MFALSSKCLVLIFQMLSLATVRASLFLLLFLDLMGVDSRTRTQRTRNERLSETNGLMDDSKFNVRFYTLFTGSILLCTLVIVDSVHRISSGSGFFFF